MKLTKISGYFDCRKYQKGVQRQARPMVAAGERVNFSVAFPDEFLPAEIAEFSNRSEKSGLNYVTFKVFPKNVKVYTAAAKQIDFPPLEKLDGGKFEVNIDFSIKHGTGTELNGCYLNAIQVLRRADNPFEAEEGYSDDAFGSNDDPFSTPAPLTTAPPQATYESKPTETTTNSGLPF